VSSKDRAKSGFENEWTLAKNRTSTGCVFKHQSTDFVTGLKRSILIAELFIL
jgi:hypothetical protein